jgi:hypothetical protein
MGEGQDEGPLAFDHRLSTNLIVKDQRTRPSARLTPVTYNTINSPTVIAPRNKNALENEKTLFLQPAINHQLIKTSLQKVHKFQKFF